MTLGLELCSAASGRCAQCPQAPQPCPLLGKSEKKRTPGRPVQARTPSLSGGPGGPVTVCVGRCLGVAQESLPVSRGTLPPGHTQATPRWTDPVPLGLEPGPGGQQLPRSLQRPVQLKTTQTEERCWKGCLLLGTSTQKGSRAAVLNHCLQGPVGPGEVQTPGPVPSALAPSHFTALRLLAPHSSLRRAFAPAVPPPGLCPLHSSPSLPPLILPESPPRMLGWHLV